MHLPPAMRRRIAYATAVALLSGGLYALKAVKADDQGASAPVTSPKPESAALLQQKEAGTVGGPAAAESKVAQIEQKPVPKVESYTVAEGDTLSGIAAKFGIKAETVLWANDMGENDTLSIGQELRVPTIDAIVYEVQQDDTLWGIATEHGVLDTDVVEANPTLDPAAIQPGQLVFIPGAQPAVRRQVASRSGGSRSTAARGQLDFWPTVGVLTDPFGWRVHPVYGTQAFHDGMDVSVSSGTPLRAASAGTVIMAGRYGGYGLVVKIDHGGGVVTQYSHMSQIDVNVGDSVGAGEHVGYSGNTGVSTGPHLHFSVFVNGSPTDPMDWLP